MPGAKEHTERDLQRIAELREWMETHCVGRANRWTRQALVRRWRDNGWKLDDRQLRGYVEAMQKAGARVVPDYETKADPDGRKPGGYYIADTSEPIRAAWAQHLSRLLSHAASMRSLERMEPELHPFGQQVLGLAEDEEREAEAWEGGGGALDEMLGSASSCAGGPFAVPFVPPDPADVGAHELVGAEARGMGADGTGGNPDDRPGSGVPA